MSDPMDAFCPTCGARSGEPCVTSAGNEAAKPHKQRGATRARRGSAVPADVLRQLRRRSGGACELHCPGCLTKRAHEAVDPHHVIPRGQGGPDTLENLLYACRPGHDWIGDHPAEARELGLLKRREPTISKPAQTRAEPEPTPAKKEREPLQTSGLGG